MAVSNCLMLHTDKLDRPNLMMIVSGYVDFIKDLIRKDIADICRCGADEPVIEEAIRKLDKEMNFLVSVVTTSTFPKGKRVESLFGTSYVFFRSASIVESILKEKFSIDVDVPNLIDIFTPEEIKEGKIHLYELPESLWDGKKHKSTMSWADICDFEDSNDEKEKLLKMAGDEKTLFEMVRNGDILAKTTNGYSIMKREYKISFSDVLHQLECNVDMRPQCAFPTYIRGEHDNELVCKEVPLGIITDDVFNFFRVVISPGEDIDIELDEKTCVVRFSNYIVAQNALLVGRKATFVPRKNKNHQEITMLFYSGADEKLMKGKKQQ